MCTLRGMRAGSGMRVEVASAAFIARRLEKAASDGFHPVSVALEPGEGEPRVVVHLERGAPPAALVGPVPFREDGVLGLTRAPRPHHAGHVASVAVAGEARDALGTGLVIAFVWRFDDGPPTPWGVHLHPLEGDALRASASVRVLEQQGRMVASQPVTVAGSGGTLSLWHGARREPAPADDVDAFAGWARRHMDRIGATRAQIVVVRDGRVDRAHALAAPGLAADATQAMRVGSVSKVVTALIAAGVARRRHLPLGLDTTIGELGLLAQGASPTLRRVTLAHLLGHTAGLVTSAELRPDDEAHPLSEHRIAADLGRPGQPLGPGDLLRWFEESPDDTVFVRAPGAGPPDYGNESSILLGEIVARLELGRDDAFEQLAQELFNASGVAVGDRGCLLGAGLGRSRARGEAPPQPTSITWVPARFDDDREVVASPFGDNGPYLGGAAGLAVPLAWLGRMVAAIGRDAGDPRAPTRADLEALLVPSGLDPRFGRGVLLGRPCYVTMRREAGALPRAVRVTPFHHHGRIDGGSALHLHLLPSDPEDGMGLAVLVAFDRLGPLDVEAEGAELIALLRSLASQAS